MRFNYRALLGIGLGLMLSHAMADEGVMPMNKPLPEGFKANPEIGKHIAETTCISCHGQRGDGLMLVPNGDPIELPTNYPSLAGQHHNYIVKQLKDFQASYMDEEGSEGAQRNDVNMMTYVTQPMIEPIPGEGRIIMDAETAEHMAAYFSSQKPRYGVADETLAERGKQLYTGGDLARNIPACAACHSPTGQGNGPANYPKLAGQHFDYTQKQLHDFKSAARENDPSRMMRDIAERLSDAEIEAVSSYIQGLQPRTVSNED